MQSRTCEIMRFCQTDWYRDRLSDQLSKAPAWYGVKAFRTLTTEDRRLAGAVAHTAIGKTGKQILDDTFSVVLPFVSARTCTMIRDTYRASAVTDRNTAAG